LPPADRRSLFAAEIMGRTYFALLQAIEARGFDVFGERVTVSSRRRIAIALACWARSRLGARGARPRAARAIAAAPMKAAVHVGSSRLELREWPEPRVGAGELLVRLRGCGLCGSDLVKLAREAPTPAVLGHEVVGEVAAVGPGVSRFALGQRVIVAHHVPCFACHYCRRGSPSMCREFKRVNLDPGGFAELVRVPAPNVAHATFTIDAGMSDETASFTEPLACCLRAIKRTGACAGDSVVVVGLGSIGCLLAQGFRLAGNASARRGSPPRAASAGRHARRGGVRGRTRRWMPPCATPRAGGAPTW
jgi:hypothetical protein